MTVVLPATLPSIETVTVSPLIPDPEMAGSAVVVMVLPLLGAVMLGAGGGTLMVKVSALEGTELGPPAAAWVAVTEWLVLLSGAVGVKLQLPPVTVVLPATLPSIETVTVSPLIPDPEMAGSAVVVMVLPLLGAVMLGAGGGTLMVKVSALEGAELGPPAAAWVAVTEWLVLLSGAVGVKLQLPPVTVVLPATLPSIETVTVSPLIPDPEMVGSAVVVMVLPLLGAVMLGAGGGTLMVKVSALEGAELGPPAAAWVAVTEWLVLLSGAVGVKLQLPPVTVVLPATLPSIETVTVSPLIPDPEMVGSAVVVMVLPLLGAVMLGAGGAVGTLMVKVSALEGAELGPPAAAWVAVTEWLVLLSGAVGVKLQLPPVTVVLPATFPSIETVTVSPLIPDPEMVGSAVVVMVLPLLGAVMLGAGGGTLMVKVSALEGAELGPPAAAWVAVTEWLVLLSGAVGVKLQLPPVTVVLPATLPSIETVTVSPLIPDPEMVGSAVVVMVLPLLGAVMLGAGGAVGTLMVKVSALEGAELGPPAAAWVAVTEWLVLLSGAVGVKLQLPPVTVVLPATLPSIETVTVSPLIPDPEMVGSAVVVMVLPLLGAVMLGAGGGAR